MTSLKTGGNLQLLLLKQRKIILCQLLVILIAVYTSICTCALLTMLEGGDIPYYSNIL